MLGIVGGRVYDPCNGRDGEVADVWVKDGRVVEAAAIDRERAEIVDAAGLVVMPGGVEIHSHLVGAKVNSGRKLRPEDHRGNERVRAGAFRSGVGGTVPTTYVSGYLYSEMGYTTIMEAATAPLVARHTHEELEDMPNLDKGVFITMGNNHFIMQAVSEGRPEMARDYVAWLLKATKGYAIKLVNPGGVENWKWGKNVSELDDPVIGYEGVTPRKIVETLAWVNEELGLPHVPHIHGINLGRSTSARTTVETMKTLAGRRAHYCHLQFLSYGEGPRHVNKGEAAAVAAAVNADPAMTVDVGQIVFGQATTMTSDGPLQYSLHQTAGGRWMNDDVESESGGGIVPIVYKRTNPVNATMWRTGLEIFLLVEDPWRVFLTTDHPNGGRFTSYPQVIRLLMDRAYREETFAGIHARARKGALLPELEREYSLYDIAVITRAGPARALGLETKGHLGVGADADIAIYAEQDDKEAMFAKPRYVFKDGVLVARDGVLVAEVPGRTFYVAPPYDPAIEDEIRAYFERAYTVAYENYAVLAGDVAGAEPVACG
ncbi:MAG TPA: formylmethanofuran dehydrogenase subunit A [Thermoleophilia bacterium]|nr:formylmethanofuran dehydrogenase subunit A [Thermoleophilia bacterium]